MTRPFQSIEVHHGRVLTRQRSYRVVLAPFFSPKLTRKVRGRVGFPHVLAVQQRFARAVNELHEMCPVRDLMQRQLFPAEIRQIRHCPESKPSPLSRLGISGDGWSGPLPLEIFENSCQTLQFFVDTQIPEDYFRFTDCPRFL